MKVSILIIWGTRLSFKIVLLSKISYPAVQLRQPTVASVGRQAVIEDHLMFCWLCFIKYLPLLCQILKIMFCWSCLCTVSMISAILYDHSVPHLIAKDSNNCDEYCNLSTILEFHEILWPEHQLLPCIWSRIQWLQIF